MNKGSKNSIKQEVKNISSVDKLDKELVDLFKKSGQEYFNNLLSYLCKKINVEYAFVGKYDAKNYKVISQSFFANKTYIEDFEYCLKNTPCETVIDNKLCVYPENVQQLFPKDQDLKTFDIESYIGLPLFNSSKQPLGILVIMDRKPLKGITKIKDVLELLESKTELEFERLFVEENYSLSPMNFHDFFQHFQDIIFLVTYNKDNQQIDCVASSSIKNILGYDLAKTTQLHFFDLFSTKNEWDAFFQLISTKKRIKNYAVPLKKKDGSILHVEIDCELIESNLPNKNNYKLRGIVKDVHKRYTEHLRTEIAFLIAEKSQRRLTNITLLTEYIYTVLKKVINLDNFYIAINDEGNKEIYFPIYIDKQDKNTYHKVKIPYREQGLTEHLIFNKKIIHTDKNGLLEFAKQNKLKLRGNLSECFVAIPLKGEGKCYGVVVMQSYKKGFCYNKNDVELLKFISTQIGYVIERTIWQEELQKQEEHYRSLVENSSEIIGIVNKDGIIEYVSESSQRIIGYPPTELIGTNFFEIIEDDDSSQSINKRLSNFDSGALSTYKVKTKKENTTYLEITFSKKNKKSSSFVFNAKNVTNRVLDDKEKEIVQKRLSILHQIEQALISDQSIDKILNKTINIIQNQLYKADRISIGVFNQEKEQLDILALYKSYQKQGRINQHESIPLNDLECLPSILKKKHFYVSDIHQLKRLKESDKRNLKEGIRSYLVYPIILENTVIGTINFGSREKIFFNHVDFQLLKEVSLLLAVVINNALLKQELENRKNSLTTIINNANDGIVRLNEKDEFIDVNPRMCEILGYKKAEILSKKSHFFTHPDDLKIFEKAIETIVNKKKSDVEIFKRYIHKNGQIIYCRVFAKAIFDNNKLKYIIAFISDRTTSTKAQKQVSDLKNALNNSNYVFYTNANGIILDVNEKLAKYTGYTRKEIIGKTPKIFNSNYHPKEFFETFWNTIKKGETFKGELRNQKKDGTIYWVFVTVTPVIDTTGMIEQFIAVQIDITEEKRAKNNLISQVIEAQEKERERFAMEIHDGLGQTMLAAKMNLSVIEEEIGLLDNNTRTIYHKGVNLLTESIQEARSISHGLMSRVLKNFGLAHSINEIINNINNTTSLHFKYHHNIEKVRFSDEVEMGVYRTLQELIKNILKHSKATTAELSIIKAKNKLNINIQDNGVGITKADINKKGSGGIGLRNMKSRIEYLGGTFDINHQIKKGCQIKISVTL